jgi:hypothetical protein
MGRRDMGRRNMGRRNMGRRGLGKRRVGVTMNAPDVRHSAATTGNGATIMKNTTAAEIPGASWV